jgi:hypothetical protein
MNAYDMIKYVHICITQCARSQELKQQETGTPTSKSVSEHEDITMLWNQGVQTDREVLANTPDIVVKTKRTEPAY